MLPASSLRWAACDGATGTVTRHVLDHAAGASGETFFVGTFEGSTLSGPAEGTVKDDSIRKTKVKSTMGQRTSAHRESVCDCDGHLPGRPSVGACLVAASFEAHAPLNDLMDLRSQLFCLITGVADARRVNALIFPILGIFLLLCVALFIATRMIQLFSLSALFGGSVLIGYIG